MAELRHRVTLGLMLFLSLVAFASYHQGTGSTAWLQWLTLVIFLVCRWAVKLALALLPCFAD